ncbi:MAG: FHIPEP family type III secretion protein, partial [Myxococcales bacterium]|nr:FHIPEP family type III secretion protein [Myxococcales bacterium]
DERDDELAPAALVAVELGAELLVLAEGAAGARLMGELIPGLREMLHGELGVVLPGVHVRAAAPDVPPSGYRVLLGEVPMAGALVDLERVLVVCDPAQAAQLGLEDARPAEAPGVSAALVSIPLAQVDKAQQNGLPLIDTPTRVTLHLGHIVRRYAFELVGIQETQQLLDHLERTHPALVGEVVPKLVTIQTLTDVLRRLVEEGVSIRNLRDILQALAEHGGTEADPVVLTEHVRTALRRQLSYAFAPSGALRVLVLDPVIEDTVRESIQRTDKGSYLAMEPELSHDIIAAIGRELSALPSDEPLPVVLTNMEIRRYVRRLVELELPDLAVLSYGELEPTVQVQPLARVAVA